VRERNSVAQMILNNVTQGKFEFKKGNTLAMFAESFSYCLDLNLKDSTSVNVPIDIMNGS
jgi:hypothetical protein